MKRTFDTFVFELDHSFSLNALRFLMCFGNFFIRFFVLSLVAVPFTFVKWLRDDVPIVDSRHPDIPPPPRITLFNNGSLQVRDVRRNDTAEYLCEILTTDHLLETQLHAIEVECEFSVVQCNRFHPNAIDWWHSE